MSFRSHSHHGHSHHHGHKAQYSETEHVTVVTEVERTAAVAERPCYGGAAQQHTFRKEVYEEVDEGFRRPVAAGERYEVYENTCEEDVETAGGEYVQRKHNFMVKAA